MCASFRAGTAGYKSSLWELYAKDCLLLENHRLLDGCQKEVRCLQKPMPSPVDPNTSQLLNQASDVICDEELMKSASVY